MKLQDGEEKNINRGYKGTLIVCVSGTGTVDFGYYDDDSVFIPHNLLLENLEMSDETTIPAFPAPEIPPAPEVVEDAPKPKRGRPKKAAK